MLWILYVIADALFNYWLIEVKKKRPHYGMLFVLRGGMAIVYGGLILHITPDLFWPFLIFVMFTFPFLFNLVLNLLRRKPFIYYGKESGLIDRFIVKYGYEDEYFLLTAVLFVISLITKAAFFNETWL